MERRLAAILSVDVVGFSRLMGLDEAGTLERLRTVRRSLVEPIVAAHRGHVVKLIGDGALVEFGSVVDAVACAVAIQTRMADHKAALEPDHWLLFRIGINLGDVIVEDDDIYGDGVNVAARLEALAEPGGIAVSGTVRDHVGNKLGAAFDDMGVHRLKNIDEPVRVFRIRIPGAVTEGGVVSPAMADRPTIAVLPFANMSGDPEQEYFSDGITEDIITDLSKISGLFVLARNTTFAQKGQALDVQSLCHRLGVRHLVEGSVRRAGNRVRITAQLIDGKTGGHLWADRFDRELIDIFAVQDEITRSIVAALRVKLLPAEQAAISSGPTENVEAYQYYLRGRKFFYQHSRRSYEIARRLFQKACELDPLFARAYAAIADCDAFLLLHHRAEVSVDAMLAASARALELDGDLAEAHASRAFALHVQGRPDEAAREFETALRLNAELFEGWYFCARACFEQGRLHDAAHCLERAAAVSPTDFQAKGLLLMVYRSLDRPAESHAAAEEALARAERELDRDPENVRALYFAGLALTCLGQQARARELLERALAIEPDDFATLYNVACAYAQLGAVEEAIGLLERVQAPANERARRWFRAWSAHDSDLDPLRAHPRFAALMRRLADAG